MKRKTATKGLALILAVLTFCMTTIIHLPSNLFTAWGFGLVFVSSGSPGHPYLQGTVEGERNKTWFLCMNKGASAKNGYDYSKVDMDVSYSEGTLEEKRMFWAYIGAFGSAKPGDDSIEKRYGKPVQPEQAKEVSWSMGGSNGGSSFVETMANDGFMALDKIPPGCKAPKDIFEAVSSYGAKETALWMGNLQKGPGEFDVEKLYNIAGMADFESFKKYCTVESADPTVRVTFGTNSFTAYRVDASGVIDTTNKTPIVLEVRYNPAVFKVIEIKGGLEFFKCNEPGSQQLYRAHGTMKVTNPMFYMSTQQLNPEEQPSTGGGDSISVNIFEHQETFESNYKVDLTKRDYETGYPLEGSTWEVLEKFDESQLSEDEISGGIVEDKMREAPNTWREWLIFQSDMVTDKNGYITQKDKRFYDFSQKYCDGHPIPPAPEETGDEEADADAADEYAALMEEWQNAVDECVSVADSSGGTFHHWECGSESTPSEDEAFEQSGCREARDDAYDNFINLEYSYTFRETDAKDGYIISSPVGHPDDVPVEIITTASSESGRAATWTQANNKDIVVSGYRRDLAGTIKTVLGTEYMGEDRNIQLTETYDLTWNQKLENNVRNLFGLPDKYLEENDFTIKLRASEGSLATPSDGTGEDETLMDDVNKPDQEATPSNTADKSKHEVNLVRTSIYDEIIDEDKPESSEKETPEDRNQGVYHFDSSELVSYSLEGKAVFSTRAGNYINLDAASVDSQAPITPGDPDNLAHSFVVYDHRVPGQIHFNKKDLLLAAGEDGAYNAYGDAQGDGTLEGAVYGLFAADAVYVPDTNRSADGTVTGGSGILFDANDLVAVATTDRNGDGSFMAITEKPHSFYNYQTGQVEYTGKAYPHNLYDLDGIRKTYPEEERGRVYQDNVAKNGDYWIGRPLILGNYYIKELTRPEGYELSITGKDMDYTNTDDTTRGNYGDSQDAKTKPVGTVWIKEKLKHAVTFAGANPAYGNRENLFTLAVNSLDAVEGYNVVIDGIPEGADFYFDDVTLTPVTIKIPTGGTWMDATEPPLYETASGNVFKRDINGSLILNPAAVKDTPVQYLGVGSEAEKIEKNKTLVASDPTQYGAAYINTDANDRYVKMELEQMLRQLGMTTPVGADGQPSKINAPVYDEPRNLTGKQLYGMPEVVLSIAGVTTNASLIEKIIDYYGGEKVFTYGSLQKVELAGTTAKVTIAVGMSPRNSELLYSKDAAGEVNAAYLFKVNPSTNRYVMRKYTDTGIVSAVKLNSTLERYHLILNPDFTVNAAGLPEDVLTYASDLEQYLHYNDGDTIYGYWYHNGTGWVGNNPVKRREYVLTFEEKVVNQESVNTSMVAKVNTPEEVADPGSTYVYYDAVSRQYNLHVGATDADLTGAKTSNFTIAIEDGSVTLSQADIDKVGENNVWHYQVGDRLNNSEYISRIAGAGAGAFVSSVFDANRSYIKNQRLIYNGNHNLNEDGNTQVSPNPVVERPIMQKIKITKKIEVNADGEYDNNTANIHKDWYTQNFGGYFDRLLGIKENSAVTMPNFRFQVFLKSNLEGLYRDNDGSVTWQDRNGNTVDITAYKTAFPADAQKLYTRVLHQENPLFRNSRDSVVANKELYSIVDGFIQENQNPGYTRILETIESPAGAKTYNYKKFFDAVAVGNEDKWKNPGNVANTSFKPFPPANEINTSNFAKENAKVSDAIRQFALTWYHEEEVKKLVQLNAAGETEAQTDQGYSDALYDRALFEAIRKAQNYLLPFFANDMEYIYAVEWDSEVDGGKDLDMTTLSIDILEAQAEAKDNLHVGISRYLPYGTYVIVEQQPEVAALNDFPNKHYKVDEPKEIELPSVYEGGMAGSNQTPEVLNPYYNYDPADSPKELASKYNIRFNEEWAGTGEDLRAYVVQAHDTYGDYEVYKYGIDLEKLGGTAGGDPTGANHFSITQSPLDPMKDYYNTLVDSPEEGGNPTSHYYPDDAPGWNYIPDAVEKIYHYGAVSENKTVRDGINAMEGMQNALEGKYAPMLVPWSVVEPGNEETDVVQNPDGTSNYQGYGYRKFINTFYTTRLRLEKLDAETGENVLHDDAVFALYAAKRDDSDTGEGAVQFYPDDTLIRGTKEFLEGMGAKYIEPFHRTGAEGAAAGKSYTGIVPAGTPICEESEQIVLVDAEGNRIGQFKALSTMRDGNQAMEGNLAALEMANQNTGYAETPQPIGAGTYVLVEVKPTSGYVRTKPIALEVYSDKVTYYLDGADGNRVTSTIYKEDAGDTARIYVNNTAVRLEVNKIKTTDTTTTYETKTRYEGTALQLKNKYGAENLEFAYNHSGKYLGYGWKKGTLEYLVSRKEAGEQVEIIYQDGIFAGYGRITRALESPADQNQNVTGAKLTLYDAIEIKANHAGGDYGYDGVTVKRDRNSNVESIKVEKGYAGEQILFVQDKGEEDSVYTYLDEINDTGAGTWTYRTIQRETTDILFYSMSGLSFSKKDADGTVMGYDEDGNLVRIKNQTSIYALKNGIPVFELSGSQLDTITYSDMDKCFNGQAADVVMYHVDENGIRDARVDMTTGMAFLKEGNRILVWAAKQAATKNGAVIATDKIQTYRIATFNAETDQEYVTGTLQGNSFLKRLNPVVNPYGLPIYYQKSGETYTKGRPIYDIDGDYVRYQYTDGLYDFNQAAYRINLEQQLKAIGAEENTQDDPILYHREGESYVMANIWLSGERYPNDPLKEELTLGQTDLLKRVVPGTYILEELTPPSGYVKTFPKPVFLTETTQTQELDLENENIKVEIDKTDDTDTYKLIVTSDYAPDAPYTEGKGSYSHAQVVGSRLVLYKANRVYTTDAVNYPKGYYLEKAEQTPATWQVENPADNTKTTVTGDWVTDGSAKYFEGIPAGDYILEELSAAGGYVRNQMDIEVTPTSETQVFNLKNDHTKLEVFKYYEDEAGNKNPLPNEHAAGLTVYEAISDAQGNILYQNGLPTYDVTKIIDQWQTDDVMQYTGITTKSTKLLDRIKGTLDPQSNASGFIVDFEAAYKNNPAMNQITWLTASGERSARLSHEKDFDATSSKVQLWTTDTGKDIRITIYKNVRSGSPELVFEYQFNYKELASGIKAYDTLEGIHRVDYIPFNAIKNGELVGNYVLVETTTPVGYETASPKALVLTETGNIQRYSLKNEEKYIHVDKVSLVADGNGGTKEIQIPGVKLALYKADGTGDFNGDPGYLVTDWITGEDGIYTEADQMAGSIINGYQIGDYRPHWVSKVPYGDYYIAELDPLDYLVKAAPQRVSIRADKVPAYKVVNKLSTGKLSILKTAEDTGDPLFGARFKVLNEQTKESWIMASGADGVASIDNLPVGTINLDGSITPHWYSVEEITPPEHYQADLSTRRFQFDGSANTAVLTYSYEVKNKPTSIRFTKTNFATEMLVEGAVVAIYKAKVVDGHYIEDGAAIEVIHTTNQGFTINKKLIASHAYIARELKAPPGLVLAKPMAFVLNSSGSGIQKIMNNFSVITLEATRDAIESMTVAGRVATSVITTFTDVESKEQVIFSGGHGDMVLTEKDGIQSGRVYEITERTSYSDGNEEVTRKETKRIQFGEDNTYRMANRTFDKTIQTLTDGNGSVVDSWELLGNKQTHTIHNPVSKEPDFITVSSTGGATVEVAVPGSVVKYQIRYKNTDLDPKSLQVKAILGEGLELLRTAPKANVSGQSMTWSLTDVPEGKEEVFEVVATVTGSPGEQVALTASMDGANCTKVLPVAEKGSVTIKNRVTGYGKDDTDQFVYQVRLKDASGNPLTGYYAYTGSQSGRIKGEGSIELSGNSYVIFCNLPHGTRYEVLQEETYGYILNEEQQSGTITAGIQVAVFENQKDDETIRDMLIQNGEYTLQEETLFTDGSAQKTGKYRFKINDNVVVDNIDLLDKPIDVTFSKRDITSEEEIAGGRYQLIDPESQTVLYEFTKDSAVKIPGELLEPGKEYLFREILAPGGYAYALDVKFTVSESGAPELVVMHDEPTRVEIIKINESGKLLNGSKHVILDAENQEVVVPEFTFEGKPLVITGTLEAERAYLLRETKAPTGYLIAADVPFTVPREAKLVTVTMVDPKAPGTPGSNDPSMYIKKIDGNTQAGLPGFEFTIKTQIGSHYRTVITGEDGYARFPMPEDGVYYYQETKTVGGYMLPPDGTVFTFTVQNQKVTGQSTVVVSNYKAPEVPVTKVDSATGEGIAGAELAIFQGDTELMRGITRAEGKLPFVPLQSGTYVVRELKAPEGYTATNDVITFTIHQDGTLTGEIILYNTKKQGYIIARYHSGTSGTGQHSIRTFGFYNRTPSGNMPGTGDDKKAFWYLAISLFSGVGIVWIYRRKRKYDKKQAD